MSGHTVGESLPPRTFTVTRADLVRYAEASGDRNPIHVDEEVARAVGLPGVIAHGMYTMALAARAVADWLPDGEVRQLGCKFTNPVVVPAQGGAEVSVAGTVKQVEPDVGTEGVAAGGTLVTVALEVTCAGQKVLGMPRAVVRVPGA